MRLPISKDVERQSSWMVLNQPGKSALFIVLERPILVIRSRNSVCIVFGLNHLLRVLPNYLNGAAVPAIVVIGVEVVPSGRFSDKLSAAVAASVDEAINRILDECTS